MPEPSPARAIVSAGILLFRRAANGLEFLLVHPGGPYFARRDEGCWSIPKGEAAPGEDLLDRARIEFAEELGFALEGACMPLGSIRQKGGKTVHAWAVEGNLPKAFLLRSNTFELEWPPHSGQRKCFPEIDRAEFFTESIARRKINPKQVELINRLIAYARAGDAAG